MATIALAFLLIAGVSPDAVVRDKVDVIEINHVYNPETGKKTLSQVIFWEFRSHYKGYGAHVVTWRRLEQVKAAPRYDHDRRLWVLLWWDDKHDVLRKVSSVSFRTTHTLYDPEIEDRKDIAMEYRRRLSQVP